jgi:hypothetical protein
LFFLNFDPHWLKGYIVSNCTFSQESPAMLSRSKARLQGDRMKAKAGARRIAAHGLCHATPIFAASGQSFEGCSTASAPMQSLPAGTKKPYVPMP